MKLNKYYQESTKDNIVCSKEPSKAKQYAIIFAVVIGACMLAFAIAGISQGEDYNNPNYHTSISGSIEQPPSASANSGSNTALASLNSTSDVFNAYGLVVSNWTLPLLVIITLVVFVLPMFRRMLR
jgi:hypothetical protein